MRFGIAKELAGSIGFLLVCASCGPASDAPPSVAVRDSAGVRILAFSSPTEEWGLAEEPSLVIGEEGGGTEEEFFGVKRAFRTRDGRVVVANSGTQEIRIFDDSGRYLQSIGGPGEGPGEFRSLDWIDGFEDGRLAALDLDLRRVTFFDPQGKVVSTLHLREGPGYPEEGPLLLPDGGILLRWLRSNPEQLDPDGDPPVGEVLPFPLFLMRLDPVTQTMDTVAVADGGEAVFFEYVDGRIAYGGPWFQRLTTYAVGEDGVYIGTQRDYEIRRVNFQGDLEEIIRGPPADLSITPGMIASYEDMRMASASDRVKNDPDLRKLSLDQMRSRPYAPARPAYGQILNGPGRELWIAEWSFMTERPTTWTVLDLDSGHAKKVTVPEGFELFDIGPDYVLGKWTDELGIETIREYEILAKG